MFTSESTNTHTVHWKTKDFVALAHKKILMESFYFKMSRLIPCFSWWFFMIRKIFRVNDFSLFPEIALISTLNGFLRWTITSDHNQYSLCRDESGSPRNSNVLTGRSGGLVGNVGLKMEESRVKASVSRRMRDRHSHLPRESAGRLSESRSDTQQRFSMWIHSEMP